MSGPARWCGQVIACGWPSEDPPLLPLEDTSQCVVGPALSAVSVGRAALSPELGLESFGVRDPEPHAAGWRPTARCREAARALRLLRGMGTQWWFPERQPWPPPPCMLVRFTLCLKWRMTELVAVPSCFCVNVCPWSLAAVSADRLLRMQTHHPGLRVGGLYSTAFPGRCQFSSLPSRDPIADNIAVGPIAEASAGDFVQLLFSSVWELLLRNSWSLCCWRRKWSQPCAPGSASCDLGILSD